MIEFQKRRWIGRLNEVIQDMNEIGGPDTLPEYIEVLESLGSVIQNDLVKAREQLAREQPSEE